VDHYVLSAGYDAAGSHWSNRHTGQDFAVDLGTPVHAVGAGEVVRVRCGGAFGIEIVLRHPDGSYTHYGHLSAVAVDEGQQVATGQWIAESGSTGNSTGPHLHFEARLTPDWGSDVDPVRWLAERGVTLHADTRGADADADD
jgi:murein DD-endopeptidase MepM/ murein hydrolase activator NlpD